jgi:putative ABC transport system substrate-binding protein
MKRVIFCLIIILFVVGCKDEERVYKVGALMFAPTNQITLEGFRYELSNKGYVEGQNLEFIYNGFVKNIDGLEAEARKIIDQGAEVIFAMTTPAARAAYKVAKDTDVQVVFGPVNDPVAAKLVKDLRSPGGNITGVRLAPSDGKRLEWLYRVKPDMKKIYFPYNPNDKSPLISLKTTQKAAKKLNLEIVEVPLKSREEVTESMAKIPDDVQAIFMPRDGLIMSRAKEYTKIGIEKGILVSTPRYSQIQNDGVVSGYGFNDYEIGKQAARIVDQILRTGIKAGDLPVETAEDYLFFNLETARKMNLHIDESLLRQAYKR